MNETDAMKLLAQANPVRAEDLAAFELADPIRRRHPNRRLAVAIAVVATAAAASVFGAFVFGGSSKHQPLIRGEATLVPPPTLEHPLPPGAKQISLSAAPAILGAPIILPDSSLAGPSDAGAVWLQDLRPHWADVAVTFSSAGLIVYYLRPSQYPEAPLALYRDEAKSQPGTSVIDLNGIPGLATAQNSDQTGQNFGAVEFVVDGTQVDVVGHYDEATLQAVAQSIVDRELASTSAGVNLPGMPVLQPRKQIPLEETSAALGAPLVLPAGSLLPRSGPRRVWAAGRCPGNCAITVAFRTVSLAYWRPAPWPSSAYEQLATKVRHSRVVTLDGVRAWDVPPNVRTNGPGRIDLVVDGTRVVVAGQQSNAALLTIAGSIVERSRQ